MTTVLYCRVSTLDQTLDHQRTQAHQNGFKLDLVLADHGVSGVSIPLRERPEGRRLFDILRAGDTLVVRWVDRLGRNYQDVTDTVREFKPDAINGAEVDRYFQEGRIREIAEYCESDVMNKLDRTKCFAIR
jgi:DNA invertase Pin-like site-specific DNA recombinase